MRTTAEPRTCLLVANTSWYLYNFRRPLARALRERGLRPVLVAPHDPYAERLKAEGFEWRELKLGAGGPNPWHELGAIAALVRLYRRERPVAVHHFTIRCVLYGTLAARLTGVPARINAVTGLGHVFTSDSPLARCLRVPLRLAYRWTLGARGSRVIFQNPEDLGVFTDGRLLDPARALLIRGSGVDVEAFSPPPPAPAGRPFTVLFAGRLLREKGILELIEAIRLLKAEAPTRAIRFVIAGETYAGNPSSVSREQVEAWRAEGLAELPGHVDPISGLLARCDLVVLPSYREGTPKILLEACAMERPVIATDVPGCREVIEQGRNGWLVAPRQAGPLAEAIARLARDPAQRELMGRHGRRKMLAEFSDTEVAARTLKAYEALGVLEPAAEPAPGATSSVK